MPINTASSTPSPAGICAIMPAMPLKSVSSFFLAYSRAREFRADAGASELAGKGKMIAALQKGDEVIIDFHNHYYPPEFIAAIRKGPSRFTVEEDADGNPVLVSPGDRNFVAIQRKM